MITRTARNLIASRLFGATTCCYTSTSAAMVVGCSTAAESTTSTWLESSGYLKLMDATYPQLTTNVFSFRATYTTSEANADWNEWGIFNASASGTDGTLLNRKLESPTLGTKLNTQQWQLTATVTIST